MGFDRWCQQVEPAEPDVSRKGDLTVLRWEFFQVCSQSDVVITDVGRLSRGHCQVSVRVVDEQEFRVVRESGRHVCDREQVVATPFEALGRAEAVGDLNNLEGWVLFDNVIHVSCHNLIDGGAQARVKNVHCELLLDLNGGVCGKGTVIWN